MSMVITNGFKFKGTILELQQELLGLRKEVSQFLNQDLTEETQKYIARLVEFSKTLNEREFLDFIDSIFPEGKTDEEKKKTPIFTIGEMYLQKYKDWFVKEQTIIVYPYEENVFYLCPFGIKYLVTKMNEHPKFESFSYWDNTDEPEDVTIEEWKDRERIWNEIFERADTITFGNAGFQFKMYTEEVSIFEIMDSQMPETLENNIRLLKFREDEKFSIRKLYVLRLHELMNK